MMFRIGIIAMFLFGYAAFPLEQLRVFRWSDVKSAGKIRGGDVIKSSGNQEECLMVQSNGTGPLTVTILEVEDPGITLPVYAIQGNIRYEGIEGTAYLEMWSHFPNGGAFFSRTLGESGPMASLRGSSDWREMRLPFSAAGTSLRPAKLVINVVFPGKGKVWFGPMTLFQYPGLTGAESAASRFFSEMPGKSR